MIAYRGQSGLFACATTNVNSEQNNGALYNILEVRRYSHHIQAIVEYAEHQCANQRAENGSAAAIDCGSSHYDCRNRIKFERDARVRLTAH